MRETERWSYERLRARGGMLGTGSWRPSRLERRIGRLVLGDFAGRGVIVLELDGEVKEHSELS